jgi:tRNA-Thr(GGU) m(6)t(6)A37 methyltransferase TsaA
MDEFTHTPVGYVRCEDKRQDLGPNYFEERKGREAVLEILPEFEAGLQDIEEFSHLYVLFVFHRSTKTSLIGHPPGHGKAHGIFATRSPHRPNGVGLTIVRLIMHEGNKLHVIGADMIDGTPILDIKPYTEGDKIPEAKGGWKGHKD